ncbi:MAG: phosphoglycerate kinase [Flavobacteriales bacterium]
MKTLDDFNVADKRVLVRVDYNVPLDDRFQVVDTMRIEVSKPTVEKVVSDGGHAILMSHLGRPKGIEKRFSLRHIAAEVAQILNVPVDFVPDAVGGEARAKAARLRKGRILLLENLRFHKEEVQGDLHFAEQLAEWGDIYVNDAFATAHRAHASTAVVARFFPGRKAAGYALEKEVKAIDQVLKDGREPVTAIVGGAKVSSKIATVENILPRLDNLIVGGGMAFTFIEALGGRIGDSIHEADKLAVARRILNRAKKQGVAVSLPIDVVAADRFADRAHTRVLDSDRIPTGWRGLDVGPKTSARYKDVILRSRTILWNGPLGVFEFPNFAKGTMTLGSHIAQATQNGAFSLVGGGDSVAAIQKLGLQNQLSCVSTGGGALLESLAGKTLPGVAALEA